MSNTTNPHDKIAYLVAVIASVTAAALCLLYILLAPAGPNRFLALLLGAIPSAVVALLAVAAVYFVFTRRGIATRPGITDERLTSLIRETIAYCLAEGGEEPAATNTTSSAARNSSANRRQASYWSLPGRTYTVRATSTACPPI